MANEPNNLSGKASLDTTDYKAGVLDLNRQIRVIESGFRATAAAMGDWDKSSAGLETRQKALTQEIAAQTLKVTLLKQEYEKLAGSGTASSKELQDFQVKINKENESLGKMQTELGGTGQKIEDLGNKEDDNKGKTDNLKNSHEGLKNVLKGVGIAAAAVGAAVIGIGAGITKLFLNTTQAADNLQEMSDKTGFTTTQLQEMDYASKQLGLGVGDVTDANAKFIRSMGTQKDELTKYNQALADAKAQGKDMTAVQADLDSKMSDGGKAFGELGINVLDSSGNLRDSKVVMMEALTALGKIPNETERDSMAMAMFGKSAQELNPLINASGGELDELYKKAHQVGAVMSEEDVAAMAGFQDQLDSLKAGLKGTVGTLATAFLPAFQGLADKAGGYLSKFSAIVRGSNGDIGKMAKGVGGLLSQIVTDIAGGIPQLLQGGLSILTALMNGIMQNLPTIMNAVIQIVMTLANFVIQSLPMILQAGITILVALITGFAQALPTLIPQIVGVLIQLVQTLISNLPLLITAGIQLLIALVTGIVTALPQLIAAIPQIIIAIVNALIIAAPLLWDAAKKIIAILWDGIKAAWSTLKDVGTQLINGIWEGIKNAANWLWNQVKGFFGTLLQKIKDFLGIKSPSSVFAGFGNQMALGLGKGFLGQMGNVTGQFKNGLNGLMNGLSPALNMNLNAQLAGMNNMAGLGGAGGMTENYHFYAPVVLGGEAGTSLGEKIKARRY
jgi:phage-related protein